MVLEVAVWKLSMTMITDLSGRIIGYNLVTGRGSLGWKDNLYENSAGFVSSDSILSDRTPCKFFARTLAEVGYNDITGSMAAWQTCERIT